MTTYYAVSNIRDLASLEVHALYKLRVDVFVAEQGSPYAEIDDTDALDTTRHILVWEKGADAESSTRKRLVGCARVFPGAGEGEDSTVHIGRLAVAADHRDSGLGSDILRQSLKMIDEQYPTGTRVVLNAQTAVRALYESFGFAPAGEEFTEAGVTHLPMAKTTGSN